MASVTSAPDEIKAARSALLRRPLTDADGFEPRHQRAATEHGPTVRKC